jgi:hypothetical protein
MQRFIGFLNFLEPIFSQFSELLSQVRHLVRVVLMGQFQIGFSDFLLGGLAAPRLKPCRDLYPAEAASSFESEASLPFLDSRVPGPYDPVRSR